jgi:hypothetical protein
MYFVAKYPMLSKGCMMRWNYFETTHGMQGCHGDEQTDTSILPSVTSDKARVRQIRINGMLTFDRIKPELLCPWWLPHRCHIGS